MEEFLVLILEEEGLDGMLFQHNGEPPLALNLLNNVSRATHNALPEHL
jgi:hypothetical protein